MVREGNGLLYLLSSRQKGSVDDDDNEANWYVGTHIRRQNTNKVWRYDPRQRGDAIHHRRGGTRVVGGDIQCVDLHTAVVGAHECHGRYEPEGGQGRVAAGVRG